MQKRILVVEDQEDNRRILGRLRPDRSRERQGRGRRARASRPDLILMLAGCDDYLAKPFSPRQLLAKIKEYV
jgi:CheY-like chemotaxis protein